MLQTRKPRGCARPVRSLFCQSPICDKATQDDPQLTLKTVTNRIWLHFPSAWSSHSPQPQDLEERPSHNRSQEKQCINIVHLPVINSCALG